MALVSGHNLELQRALGVRSSSIGVAAAGGHERLSSESLNLVVLRPELSGQPRGPLGQIGGRVPVPGRPFGRAEPVERIREQRLIHNGLEGDDARQELARSGCFENVREHAAVCRCRHRFGLRVSLCELQSALEQGDVERAGAIGAAPGHETETRTCRA